MPEPSGTDVVFHGIACQPFEHALKMPLTHARLPGRVSDGNCRVKIGLDIVDTTLNLVEISHLLSIGRLINDSVNILCIRK